MPRVVHSRNKLSPPDSWFDLFGAINADGVLQEGTVWISPEPALPKIPLFYDAAKMQSVIALALTQDFPEAQSTTELAHTPDDLIEALHGAVDLDKWLRGDHEQLDLFRCLAVIQYDKHGRKADRPLATVHLYAAVPLASSVDALLDFGEEIRGGELKAVVIQSVFVAVPVLLLKIHVKVRGRNPSKPEVRAEIARQMSGSRLSGDAIKMQVIAFTETKFHQFWASDYPARSGDEVGEPVFGGQNDSKLPVVGGQRPPTTSDRGGFGILQIDNGPLIGGGSGPATPEEIWNWKKNIARGIHIFTQKKAEAIRRLLQLERDPVNRGAPVVASTVYGITKFTEAQIDREIYQHYNSGNYYDRYSPSAGEWVPVLNLNRGYGPYCLAVQSAILDGKSVPGW